MSGTVLTWLTVPTETDCNPISVCYYFHMTTTLIEIEIRLEPKPRPRRWKIQRRVDVYARDRENRRFLFAKTWHTVKQVDRLTTAERVIGHIRREDPDHDFRLAEEWPIGSEVRARE